MSLKTVSLAERPDLKNRIGDLEGEAFPVYINAEPTWNDCFPGILETMPDLQLFFLDETTDELLAVVSQVAFTWDGTAAALPGYNDLLRNSLEEVKRGTHPNALCGIMAIIPEEHQGKGISQHIFTAVFGLIESRGFEHYLIPVRPTLKHLYPNFSTAEYLDWKTSHDKPFDPWIRSNMALSPTFLAIAHDSINVTASIAQWEEWCEMQFPVSGSFVIPGGHKLLQVNREGGTAYYGEDHVWYSYGMPNGGD